MHCDTITPQFYNLEKLELGSVSGGFISVACVTGPSGNLIALLY